jgi:outer membrane immunogenic protein
MTVLRPNFVWVCAAGALLGLPLAAQAADLYRQSSPPPAYPATDAGTYVVPSAWAGFYGGINGGYGWNAGTGTIGYSDGPAAGDSTGRAAPQGGFGGGQIGYNFQRGSFVLGFETDIQGASIADRTSGTSALGNPYTSKEDIDWFGTVRGRLGFASGSVLFYGTGGFAYGGVRERAFDNAAAGSNATQTGWVAGGGIEYKFAPSWSLKGEYQYIDLGSEKLQGGPGAPAVTASGLDTSLQTVRLGLNYRFGGGSEPLK